jgi:hypothetical protein
MTDNDLGLGRVVAEQAEGRYLNKDGTPNSRKYGQGSQTWQRLYLKTLAATWPSFLMWAFGLILLVAGAFAVGYRSLGPEALSGTERLGLTDPFFAAFAYSVAILTGVGAGPVVAVGSSAQVALFVAPVLVLLSFVFGPNPMALVFNGYELVGMLLAVLLANFLTQEGESNWFEGVQLLAVYAVLGLVFYFA